MTSSSKHKTRILTGIKPSGIPHIGNYAGALRPALTASHQPNNESFYFLADLHSLINTQDPARVQRSTLEIAAAWLAAGLDPDQVWFYRQSDIPEIHELNWLLTCVSSKGILNRAHAYKAAQDRNRTEGEDADAGINAGLFMYPVLMAADILIFDAHKVPVGRDQVQHIEMARDFAQRFNHVYGHDCFTLPDAVIDENLATLPGLDGRKMSKSYGNTIPLFATQEELKQLVFSILTDSRTPGEPKPTEGSALFQLYQAFANSAQTEAFEQAFADGIGWGDAKQQVFERINAEISPLRERYETLITRPDDIESILRDGAHRVREKYAKIKLAQLRDAVGLRSLSIPSYFEPRVITKRAALPMFKQYRKDDGLFYFKLLDGNGTPLLESEGLESSRDAKCLVDSLRHALLDEQLDALKVKLLTDRRKILLAVKTLRETT